MSTDKARPPAGGGMFGGGGPGAMGMRLPAEKPQDFRGSLRRMRNRLHPERVIIAHGRWFETEGAAELRRSFRWLLD